MTDSRWLQELTNSYINKSAGLPSNIYEFKDPINQKLAQTYSKMVSESHTTKEITGTPTAELRKLAATYERSASDHGVKHDAAIEAGEKDKAAMLKKKMLDHADEAMDIRAEIRKRIGK